MRRTIATLIAVLCHMAPLLKASAADEIRLVRTLPGGYIPGRTMTVLLESEEWIDSRSLYADVYETIPEGWTLGQCDPGADGFDEATRTVHWRIERWGWTWDMEPWPFTMSYDLTPPPDPTGEVSFDGTWEYALSELDLPLCFPTGRDAAISSRVGVTRQVPDEFPTIQAAIDASLFGDAVVVSPKAAPYVEDLEMKQGVDLVGSPGTSPPALQSVGYPAVETAPHTTIHGFHVISGGIRAGRAVQISNCLVTGIPWAGIYVTSSPVRITNCTMVGNICGVYAGLHSPNVLVTNCIFRDNGSPSPPAPFPKETDVSGAHVTYSCLEHPIYMGSEENNIYANPRLLKGADGSYTLAAWSPCIDAGDNSVVSADEKDLLGNPRIMFGRSGLTVDMGAYEFPESGPRLDPLTNDFRLTWSSIPGKTYSVFSSEDAKLWQVADDSIPAVGSITLWLDPIASLTEVPMRFYRVMGNE